MSNITFPMAAPAVRRPPSSQRWNPTTLSEIGRARSAPTTSRRVQRAKIARRCTTTIMYKIYEAVSSISINAKASSVW